MSCCFKEIDSDMKSYKLKNPRAIQQKIIANKPTEEMKWNTENTQ